MSSPSTAAGLAIVPGRPRSLHLTSIALPEVGPGDALVRVRRAGVCGTDRELIEGHFGAAPEGSPNLVLGHEVLAVVERVGSAVTNLHPGDLVTATARRPCSCRQCQAGESDFCSLLEYKERGIRGLHGYMTERFVEDEGQLVRVPPALEAVGVLVEPFSVAEKAWRVAQAVQRRIASWEPRTAVVYGAGPIGMTATLMLRAHGLDVHTLDLKPAPNRSEEVVRAIGGSYVCMADRPIADLKADLSNVDVIIECTGSSAAVLNAIELLGVNGVLVLLSNIGGDRKVEVSIDHINRLFVGGNRTMVGSVNSSLADFHTAIVDLEKAEARWPGVAERLITRRLRGLDDALTLPDPMIGEVKVVIEMDA